MKISFNSGEENIPRRSNYLMEIKIFKEEMKLFKCKRNFPKGDNKFFIKEKTNFKKEMKYFQE